MKLSISNIAWSENENEEMYEFLKENKIDLEIAPTKIIKENPYDHLKEAMEYIKNLKERYGINISSMQSIWFGRTENIFESEESRNNLILYTKKAVDFAASINCPNLVFGCPKNRNMFNKKEDYVKAISFFKEIGYYASKKNVIISIEPNPIIYNTNFLNYTIEAIEFVKEINIDNIKVNYDLGTAIQNEENLEILKDNIQYINHVHISEPNLELIKKRKIHEELFKILKNKKYENYVSIEMKQTEIENVKQKIKYIIDISR